MRRDKVTTRILLILSVVYVSAAAPAIIRQRSLEVDKNVTPALEKRANLDDESSHHFPRMDNNLPSTSATLPSQGDTSPAPGDPQLHGDSPPELGTPQLHIEHPPTSETGTPQLQDDLLPAPGGPPLQEDLLPAYGTLQLHNDRPSTPGAPPTPDDTLPGPGTMQSQDEPSQASGDPELHSGPPPQFSRLHIDVPSTSGTPQLQNDMPGTPPLEDDMSESSATRTLQYEPPKGPLFEDDQWRAMIQAALRGESSYEGSPGETSYGGSPAETLYGGYPGGMLNDGSRWGTLQLMESETPSSAPETHSLFNDAMKQKLKIYGVVGAVAGVSVGLAFGIKKLINGHSHGSDPADNGVVGSGASSHSRPPKNPVSRALAKLRRDEDLRLLSILTRRALGRLD